MSSHTGLGDPLMLERIDKLIACGIASLINLPQIVVVGDQSSGKSSVLAGLIRKELPRDSGLCTRFATNIIFRRSEQEGISASIIADTHASEDHRTAVEAWTRSGLELLEQSTFTEVMREVSKQESPHHVIDTEQVHQVMGLSMTGSSSTSGPTFSNDIFRLEISGPDQEHLSVIDVPGIFKNTTPGVTKKSDITLVRNMVLEYMNNPRSVMLAVVPANVDVATQEILELALDVDPTGDRTLGVLTKPDLVDTGAEHRVIDLVENRTRQMKLGWHIVRNLGQQQLNDPSLDRNAMEMDFFRSAKPWKEIEKDKVGVENLRERLRDVLSGLVRREFPKVCCHP